MSDFHLKTELEGDPDENKQRMAEAFEAGLRHCATDPLIRLKMILGETYAAHARVIEELQDKLIRESDAVRELAIRALDDYTILDIKDPSMTRTQLDLLGAALNPEK